MSEDSYHPDEDGYRQEEEDFPKENYIPVISEGGNNMDFPLPEINISSDFTTPTTSIPMKSIRGKRRQKSLQFITTEMVLIILRHLANGEPASVNPSTFSEQLHITRRRIYDIIHVMTCLGLLSRACYRFYGWEGLSAMRLLLTQLNSTQFDEFESCFSHCFKKKQNHANSSEEYSSEESTTKHITIKFLKYLFLYYKSGRSTFNQQDITPLILHEFNLPHRTTSSTLSTSHIKASRDREKSIERRLYDIISVMCGLGILKRKTDALDWTLSDLDKTAEETRVRSTYNKGNNIMICIQPYLYDKEAFLGNKESGTISVEDVWEYVLRTFIQQDMVLVIDIPYFQKSLRFQELQPITVGIPAIPAASLQTDETPFKQIELVSGIEMPFNGNLLVASHHLATIDETPSTESTIGTPTKTIIGTKPTKTRGKRRIKAVKNSAKFGKKSIKRDGDDEEWKLPYHHKEGRKSKRTSKSGVPEIEATSAFQEKALFLSELEQYSTLETGENTDNSASGKEKFALILSPDRFSPVASPFLMLMSPDKTNYSILPSPVRFDSLPSYPFSPTAIGFSPLRRSTADIAVTDLIPAFSEDIPIILPLPPAPPALSALPAPSEENNTSVEIANKETSPSITKKATSPSPSNPLEVTYQ